MFRIWRNVLELSKEVVDVNQQGRKEYLILDEDDVSKFQEEEEDTRKVAMYVLKKQLDVTVPKSDITACHRLKNKGKIILKCRTKVLKENSYGARMSKKHTETFVNPRKLDSAQVNASGTSVGNEKKKKNLRP